MMYQSGIIPYSVLRRRAKGRVRRVGFPVQKPYETKIEPMLKVGDVVVDKERMVRKQRTKIGYFECKLDSHLIPQELTEFHFGLPKIPHRLLEIAISDFKRQPDKEAVVFFCYSKKSKSYYLKYPEYTADRVHIDYRHPRADEGDLVVLSLHSHNTLSIGARFSETDDEDSYAPGLYGVIGHVDRVYPDRAFRAGTEGVFLPISEGTLFEMPKEAA